MGHLGSLCLILEESVKLSSPVGVLLYIPTSHAGELVLRVLTSGWCPRSTGSGRGQARERARRSWRRLGQEPRGRGQQGLSHGHHSQREGTSQREERGCGGGGEGTSRGAEGKGGSRSALETIGEERTLWKLSRWDWKLGCPGGEWKWTALGVWREI